MPAKEEAHEIRDSSRASRLLRLRAIRVRSAVEVLNELTISAVLLMSIGRRGIVANAPLTTATTTNSYCLELRSFSRFPCKEADRSPTRAVDVCSITACKAITSFRAQHWILPVF